MKHKVECYFAEEKLLEIRIYVGDLICLCPIVPNINSHKFKKEIDRIISLINRNSSRITVRFDYDFTYVNVLYYAKSIEFTMDSSCFEKIKLSKSQKQMIYEVISKKKGKSQISYINLLWEMIHF